MSNDTIARIKEHLIQTFQPSELEIIDNSHKHIGHPGNTGGGHYQVIIASTQFANKSRIACHRMVYDSVQELLKNDIHALQIQIKK